MTKEADVPTPEKKVCPCGLATVDHSLAMIQRCTERFAPVPTPGASEAEEPPSARRMNAAIREIAAQAAERRPPAPESAEALLRGALYCIDNHYAGEGIPESPCDCDQAEAARAYLKARAKRRG